MFRVTQKTFTYGCLGRDSQTGWNKQIPKHRWLKKTFGILIR